MHYPDGDNIVTDSNGASWFTDGPPATTLKADVMNALVGELANILKAYNIPLKNSGNDTFDQIAGALIARDQGKTREASVVIASSDSDENARLTADVVISTAQNCIPIIEAQIDALMLKGGGKILVRAGNYYGIADNWTNKTDITLQGEGDSTVFNIGIGIDGNLSAITLCDFKVKNSGMGGVNTEGVFVSNVTVENSSARSIAFSNLNNLQNCRAICTEGVGSLFGSGYDRCIKLSNCTSSGYNVGFDSCTYLNNCSTDGKGVAAAGLPDTGFFDCDFVVQCYSNGHTMGFSQCRHISNSQYFRSSANSVSVPVGFYDCAGVANCYVTSAISALAFRNCHGFIANRSRNNLSAYTSCTPEWASSANPAADTAAGGWNVTS